MRFFDLHCDTLYKAYTENKPLDSDCFHFSKKQSEFLFDDYKQCLAIWIPDDLSDTESRDLFESCVKKFNNEIRRNETERSHFILTLENGRVIDGDIEYINKLSELGIKIVTLTWNAVNCIGGGADAPNTGLTPFGKNAVAAFEKRNIIIDISHASDRLFCDVASNTKKPFIATHSNSRIVCNHRRNLTDEQFTEICRRKGLVGLNFHSEFLRVDSYKASATDLLRHAYHFLSLGGEDVVAMGSDFDGADIPLDLRGTNCIPNLYEIFIKSGFNQQIVQKIMYDNAHNFYANF